MSTGSSLASTSLASTSLPGSSSVGSSSSLGGAPHHLAFESQPAGIHVNTPFAIRVQVLDSANHLATGSVSVTISIKRNANGSHLAGTNSVNSASGVAAFTDLQMDQAGVGYTLQAQAPSLSVLESNLFDVGGAWHAANGAPWGLVRSLAQDKIQTGNIYAAGNRGIFYSPDGAVTWSAGALPASPAYEPRLVVGDPNTAGKAWAGTTTGILRSLDYGHTWVSPSADLDAYLIYVLAVPRGVQNTVYAGTANGVYKSTDDGAHWVLKSNGMADHAITGLVIDDLTPTTLYAGSTAVSLSETGGNIFKSTDGGDSWTQVVTSTGTAQESINTMAGVHVTGTSRLYVGRKAGFLRSVDDGATFEDRYSGISTFGNEGVTVIVARLVSNLERVRVTNFFWLYDDFTIGGNWGGWNLVPSDYVGLRALLWDAQNDQTMYLATVPDGIAKTTDNMMTWVRRANGITQTAAGTYSNVIEAKAVFMAAGTPPALMVRTDPNGGGNGFYSTNGGATWLRVIPPKDGNGVYLFNDVRAAIPAPSGGGTWVATDFGVWRTQDYTQWTMVGTGAEDSLVALAADPQDTNRIYATSDSFLLYLTSDGGQTWTTRAPVSGNPYTAVLVDPQTPANVYITVNSRGIYKSVDRGVNFDNIGSFPTGNPPAPILNPTIRAIWMDRTSPQTLIASVPVGTTGHLFRSTDGAASWTEIPAALPPIWALVELPTTGNARDLIASGRNGVYRSSDYGTTWTEITGLGSTWVQSLAVDPNLPDVIFGGSKDSGVFRFSP